MNDKTTKLIYGSDENCYFFAGITLEILHFKSNEFCDLQMNKKFKGKKWLNLFFCIPEWIKMISLAVHKH